MGDKRKDYITWDEYFMGVALLSGMRSKDPEHAGGSHALSVRTIRLCPWAIMDSLRAVMTMNFPGAEPEKAMIQSIHL